jgi:DNA-binding FrmR family transcriptional regulator
VRHLVKPSNPTPLNAKLQPGDSSTAAPASECSHSSASTSTSQAAHPHIHSEESLKKIVNRLSRLEGHIRGIKTMVQENRPCPDVLVQVAAVRGGLDRVARVILDEHLSQCITRAAAEGNIEEEIEALKTALDRFVV